MTSSTDLTRRCLFAAATLILVGCGHDTPDPIGGSSGDELIKIGLETGSTNLAMGDTLRLMVTVELTSDGPLAGLLGTIRFDPAALRFVGQPLAGRTLVLVNSSRAEAGVLRVISLRQAGLEHLAADLRFEVRRPGYAAGIHYELEQAVTPALVVFTHAVESPTAPAELAADAPGTVVKQLALEDWLGYFGISEKARIRSAGDGRIFGDVTLNGVIDIIDAYVVANIAVGNRDLLVDSLRDNAIAGNVTPFNLPGLGEADDPIPPGQNSDGSFSIDILDAAVIANEAVGNEQPVVGEPIPGRQARPGRVVVSGDILADRTFKRDTVYELHGVINVPGGVTLTIQPGTLVEGDGATGARLVVRRGGNINWVGTRLEPVVFTCKDAVKTPGCWGGVVINGLSLLNNSQSGDPLPICPEKTSIGNPGTYGGCLVEDTSGVMRYVRIEYGGQSPAGGAATPGLALLGVGTGTTIDHVQVHGSQGDGLFLSGGTVNLRYLVLTANHLAGLRWDDGYGGSSVGGDVQFVVVQQGSGGGDGIRGSNAAVPDAGPRARPQLYNLTVVGAGTGGGSGRGIVFESGSAGTLRNTIVYGTSAAGLDIVGAESCAQVGAGNLLLDHSLFFGNVPDFATDSDCIDETAFATDPARVNRVTDPHLIAAANTLTPDWRPKAGLAATTGAVAPPSNLFFDITVGYVGAVEPADFTASNVPWFAGWSRGWSGAP